MCSSEVYKKCDIFFPRLIFPCTSCMYFGPSFICSTELYKECDIGAQVSLIEVGTNVPAEERDSGGQVRQAAGEGHARFHQALGSG